MSRIFSNTRIKLVGLLLFAVAEMLHATDGKIGYRSQHSLVIKVKQLQEKATKLLQKEDGIKEAISLLHKGLSASIEGNYAEGIISCSYELGRGYLAISDNANATRFFYTAINQAEVVSDSVNIYRSYTGLGLVKYGMNKWAEANDNFEKAITFDRDHEPSLLINYLMALCHFKLGHTVVALKLLAKAETGALANGDTMRILEIRLCRNNIYSLTSASDTIMQEYNFLIQEFTDANERIGVCLALEGKSRYFMKSGQFLEAQKSARAALDILKKMELVYPSLNLLDLLVKAEYASGNYKSATEHLMELNVWKDSLLNEDVATSIAKLSAGYEFNKKEANFDSQIKEKNRQKVGLLFLVLALACVAFLVFLSRRGVAKERKRSDTLLANILPEQTAKELKEFGSAKAKAHTGVTIVFADIKNFTKIAGTLEPEVLVKMLHTYFSEFDAIMSKLGLEKIKTIGDAYMFVGGLSESKVISAHKAIDASFLMLEKINMLESKMIEKYGNCFYFRIGMHTGNLVSGVVGSVKYAFDIWGDAVNIASRMEENSEPGKVNISDDTYQLVSDSYTFKSRGKLVVKNGGEREMYFVLAKK